MARFEFKLEPLLRHRRRLEDQAQRELAKLLRQKMIFEQQLRSMQQTITDDKRTMAASLVGHVDVERIRNHGSHVNQVTLRARQIAARMVGLLRQIDQGRAKLIEAMKQRKAIDLLRQRQFDKWQRDLDRRENAMLDELATQAYARRQRKEAVA